MTKIDIREDIGSIKNELIENPEIFIQRLIESLGRIKNKPFSNYKVNLSLSYLKQVYERAFPSVKHGGLRSSKAKEFTSSEQKSSLGQVALSSTWSKNVSLVDRAALINLFKGIKHRGNLPSFVKLIASRTELSSRAIEKRIYVGDYIVNCTEVSRNIALFRSNKISHTKFLTEITTMNGKKNKI